MDEEDDLYGDSPSAAAAVSTAPAAPTVLPTAGVPGLGAAAADDAEEEGEEVEEEVEVSDDESEIDFILERKDGTLPQPPPAPARYNSVRMAPAPSAQGARPSATPAPDAATPAAASAAAAAPPADGTQHPAVATSKLSLTAVPSYAGTPITKLSLDSDVLPADKPWRKPGADVTDYFNYGFDEFTWSAYCAKQEGLRDEFNPAKMMEQMGMAMMGLGAMDPAAMMGLPGMDPAAMPADDPQAYQAQMAAMQAAGMGGMDPAAAMDPQAQAMFMQQQAAMAGAQAGFQPAQGPAGAMGGYGGYGGAQGGMMGRGGGFNGRGRGRW